MKLLLPLLLTAAALAADPVAVRLVPAQFELHRPGASQQLLLIAEYADGSTQDLTDAATWSANAPAGLVTAGGTPGPLPVTATHGQFRASATGRLETAPGPAVFRFRSAIGPILTRRGCNSPACHGGVKGRGGLKLSAASLFPRDDYDWIVQGGEYQVLSAESRTPRTPRVDLRNPHASLLLRKATGTVSHGGGPRFAVDSLDYRTILDWIRQGAPFGPPDDDASRITAIEVFPKILTLEKNRKHRLLVTAVLANGRREDLTAQALYLTNDRQIATVADSGLVAPVALGETSILVRAAGQAAAVIVGVIGDPVAHYPPIATNNFIDEHVFDKLRRLRILPSGLSSDAEFLRRVCLDLTGTLPPPGRATAFVNSRDPQKRQRVIEALIATPEFTDYWTFRFQDLFRVALFANGINPKWSQMYGEWIRESIARNKPYDRMAWERLTAQGYDGPTRHFLPYDVIGTPEETMAEEVRVFFGRRLECAQCHNHPYETWSQDQFWGLAAFFGRLFKMGDTGNEYVIFDHPLHEGMGNAEVNGRIETLHPRTKAKLVPTLLDGRSVPPSDQENPRKALASWMVQHPYFAEAAVNRLWAEFFGRGLVDPVDDFRSTNPATHPELLSRLAAEFRRGGHDLRALMRLIVNSRTYQLSAATNPTNRADRANYSHALPRPLLAEVLLDAIGQVTGVPERFTTTIAPDGKITQQTPTGTRAIHLREPDLFHSRFLELYGRPNRLALPERSGKANLGQALHMLAGSIYNEKLTAPASRLQTLLRAQTTDGAILEDLYLTALGRLPEAAEREQLLTALATQPDRNQAWKDLYWAVLCSREFAENH
ncbi:MAG: DUF1553 domain-containing protein [Acidobacteriota bacterium]